MAALVPEAPSTSTHVCEARNTSPPPHGLPKETNGTLRSVSQLVLGSPKNVPVTTTASISAVAALDESFFRVRFDRLTPAEKRYLRAMAEIGPGPHRSGDIAEQLQRAVTSLGPTRSSLIGKGMVWSPSHGDTAFTVPLFDEFMHRIMPGGSWRE